MSGSSQLSPDELRLLEEAWRILASLSSLPGVARPAHTSHKLDQTPPTQGDEVSVGPASRSPAPVPHGDAAAHASAPPSWPPNYQYRSSPALSGMASWMVTLPNSEEAPESASYPPTASDLWSQSEVLDHSNSFPEAVPEAPEQNVPGFDFHVSNNAASLSDLNQIGQGFLEPGNSFLEAPSSLLTSSEPLAWGPIGLHSHNFAHPEASNDTVDFSQSFICDKAFDLELGNIFSPIHVSNLNTRQPSPKAYGSTARPDFPVAQGDQDQQEPPLRPNQRAPAPRRRGRPKVHQHVPGAIERRRKAYNQTEKQQTNLTRRMGMCIRCRINRKRCEPNPSQPNGPCLTCEKMIFNVSRLPCLRYKIVDCALYRDVSNTPFERTHPLTGPRFGDFDKAKKWVNSDVRIFDIGQGRDTILRLPVRQFEPPREEADENLFDAKGPDGKGRNHYVIPWAISDLDKGIEAINNFIDDSVPKYIDLIVGESDTVAANIFSEAYRLGFGPQQHELLHDVLRLWTAARFLEGGWRCCGADKLGAEAISPPWRPIDQVALPPYIDYQMTSILLEKVLRPLRKKVLRTLEQRIERNLTANWFTIFLTVFIFMHSFELIMKHEVEFTMRRKMTKRYYDMRLIRAYQSGAKTLLAHFHYINKGNLPFQEGFDWKAQLVKDMADLDDRQLALLQKLSQSVIRNAPVLQHASTTDNYETPFWFTGQLFDKDWRPRDTCEYAPPSDLYEPISSQG